MFFFSKYYIMNRYLESFKKLCTPAFVYLILSIVSILLIAIQNLGNNKKYCIGLYECSVQNTIMIFVFKTIYVLFWTFILNSLCRAGFTDMSWFLVLLPFILFFVLIGWFIFTQGAQLKKV